MKFLIFLDRFKFSKFSYDFKNTIFEKKFEAIQFSSMLKILATKTFPKFVTSYIFQFTIFF